MISCILASPEKADWKYPKLQVWSKFRPVRRSCKVKWLIILHSLPIRSETTMRLPLVWFFFQVAESAMVHHSWTRILHWPSVLTKSICSCVNLTNMHKWRIDHIVVSSQLVNGRRQVRYHCNNHVSTQYKWIMQSCLHRPIAWRIRFRAHICSKEYGFVTPCLPGDVDTIGQSVDSMLV